MPRSATTVWRLSGALVLALDDRLGLPLDSYVNGTQTWLTEIARPDVTLEWRLHPVPGYRTPAGLSHYDVWEQVTVQLADGVGDDALLLGEERRTLRSLWDGLECFAPFDDDVEPAVLTGAVVEVLGISPDAAGLVDHERVGAEWERSDGTVSIVEMLLAELHAT